MSKKEIVFHENGVLLSLESLRHANGAFVAAPTDDYNAMWIRDTLYATFAYWYLNEFEKLTQGIHLIFDVFKLHQEKIKLRVTSPREMASATIHAKYDPDTLGEITEHWGHAQYDALGLFLHIVADLDFKHIRIIRDEKDQEVIQDIVNYLRAVEYWHMPDFGMWEECRIRHSSSIGAVVGGLSYVRRRRLALVADPLICLGEAALLEILPHESRDLCNKPHHRHDCDAAQLSLIWPYNILSREQANHILERIINGHVNDEQKEYHKLLQVNGLNRYWGDDYYRSTEGQWRGISAEWPLFVFWLSIIYSQYHEYDEAIRWFRLGCKTIVDGKVPEAYQNGRPNDHTPLAWANAIALIAFRKLPQELRQEFMNP